MEKRSPKALDSLQAWMLGFIAGGLRGEEKGNQEWEVEAVIQPSLRLRSMERLAIYQRSYRARLLQCFQSEYPALLYALGEELFQAFVADYLANEPPRNYSLHRLAEGFPQYLETTRPRWGQASKVAKWPDFLVELAALERAFHEVYDGPGTEGWEHGTQEIHSISWELLAEESFESAPCLRLFKFRFPVAAYLTAVRRHEAAEFPQAAANWVVLTRRDFRVRLYSLPKLEWEFLQALKRGLTVREAHCAVVRELGSRQEISPLEVRVWLGRWLGRDCLRPKPKAY